MNEFIEKLSKGELSADEIKAYESSLSEAGQKILKEALAFTAKRQDEADKFAGLEKRSKELADQIKLDEEKLNGMQDQGKQFRQEQVDKAKDKFFKEYSIPAEKQAEYLEKFKALDSGKVDSDLIFKDFEGVYAFLNKDTLLDAEREKKAGEARAAAEAAKGAGGGNGQAPATEIKPNEFSPEANALAKKAGIPVEAADRQVREGMSRTIGE